MCMTRATSAQGQSFPRRIFFRVIATTVFTLGFIGLGASVAQGQADTAKMSADSIIAKWPEAARMAAQKVISEYGQPNEANETTLMWHNNGPWKHTIASRTPNLHLFPAKHMDSVEEVINYKVPLDKYNALAQFDGSVNVDRTKGEMSARCDLEANNFLALNLAHDIITGKKNVAEARAYYGRAIKRVKETMIMDPYMKGLTFAKKQGMVTADSDKSIIKVKMKPAMKP